LNPLDYSAAFLPSLLVRIFYKSLNKVQLRLEPLHATQHFTWSYFDSAFG